jgi:hypothetical protein
MTTYELINPSDPYTFKAPNIEVAGVVAVLLSTAFGAKAIDPPTEDGETTPIIFGWNEWLQDRGINDDWVDSHAADIAEAYDSFLIGSLNQRHDVEKILALLSAEKREEWKADRQDRHRTSMNRIGEAAMSFAKKFRKIAEKKKAESP